jgi:hypothetical protein
MLTGTHRWVTSTIVTPNAYLPASAYLGMYVQTVAECVRVCSTDCRRCVSINASPVGVNAALGNVLPTGLWWYCELNFRRSTADNKTSQTETSLVYQLPGWIYYAVDVDICMPPKP